MRERGIIFSGPMVRAILDGRKIQTRRVMKNPPTLMDKVYAKLFRKDFGGRKCPYGIPGDRLYVRECWKPTRAYVPARDGVSMPTYVRYRADDSRREVPHNLDGSQNDRWRPSIHMPKWASRIWLDVVSVGVERVGDISEEDAISEGLTEYFWPKDLPPEVQARVEGKRHWEHVNMKRGRKCSVWDSSVKAFRELWDDINGKRETCAWRDNPWVWCLSFRRIDP